MGYTISFSVNGYFNVYVDDADNINEAFKKAMDELDYFSTGDIEDVEYQIAGCFDKNYNLADIDDELKEEFDNRFWTS